MNQTAHQLGPRLMPGTFRAGPAMSTTLNLDDDLLSEAPRTLVHVKHGRNHE